MFSLIIVLVSIALVVALAVATIYYGGDSSKKAAVRASASTLINQAAQINAAGTIAVSQGGNWPAAAPHFSQPYLTAMPVPPKSAYAAGLPDPAATDWEYYVDEPHTRHFVLKDKIKREVCLAVNREQGVIGIPAAWDGKTLIQCFGPGVTTAPRTEPAYTFFYDPLGTSPADDQKAIDTSRDEAGVPGDPGYPRLCPDGTTITSGLCADSSGGPAGPTTPTGPTGPTTPTEPVNTTGPFNLYAIPGSVTTAGLTYWGDDYVDYCSSDVPADILTPGSVVRVNGTPVNVEYDWNSSGMYCLNTSGTPRGSVGTATVTVVNENGSTHTGTLQYISSYAPGAEVDGISPSTGPVDQTKLVTITGNNFVDGATVYLENVHPVATTFVDSQTLRFTMPKGYQLGYKDADFPSGTTRSVYVSVMNPNAEWPNNSPRYRYTAPAGNFTPGMTQALEISNLRADGSAIVFTSKASCTPGTNVACIPAFRAQTQSWSWTPPSEFRQTTETDTVDQYRYINAFGLSISDGTRTYTVIREDGEQVDHSYLTFSDFAGKYTTGPGGSFALHYSTLTVPEGYTRIGRNPTWVETATTYGYRFHYNTIDDIDLQDIRLKNPGFSHQPAFTYTCTTSECLFSGESEGLPMRLFVKDDYQEVRTGWVTHTGVVGSWPIAPAQ